ncbi:hypothetical protein WH87_15965 [Devosia epidermidihirudinis]|uniref:Tricorn protease homolog n=1 Tax=Devosia epidermidihirudinis TaxID=1293439 RepID=A0A0F5Q3T4_9HYPH|nr:S41 family peptidase [Devosia epidermidihirudinis]KKC35552.1 hypothetical protein WH87_15965 [Devosia epidermidihirudinis]
MLKQLSAISLLALMVGMTSAHAQPTGEAPRWLRFAALSPDGETISFTHRGQIFVVPAEGGLAVSLTAQGSYSYGAVWSPDSERLAFASDIGGNDDIYVADFSGTLQRFSWSSAHEVPTSFTPDGKSILYTSLGLGDAERSVQGALSFKPQLYAANTQTGRETLVLPNYALEAQWNAAQDKLAYVYNPSVDPDERQHRVAANARQIWIYDAVSGRHEDVFGRDGIDRVNPVWSKDGAALYYLSERSGWLNAWQLDIVTGVEKQLTFFEGAPVRDLSVADNGTIAFGYDGRIYVQSVADAKPQAIEIFTLDQRASLDANFPTGEATRFVSSPDGKRMALVASADVFLLDREGNYRQITATPGEERDVAFSPDGSTLVYAGQRGHEWGIYAVDLQIESSDDPLAIQYQEIALYVPEEGNAFQPQFSPDGKLLAFISDRREVKVLDLSSGTVAALFAETDYNSSYGDGDLWFAWSPTSEDIMVQWRYQGGSDAIKIAIVPADGSGPPQMISQGVNNFARGVWSLDGTQVIGATDLFGLRSAQLHGTSEDLYRIFLSEAARQDFLDISEGVFPTSPSDEEDALYEPLRYPIETVRSARLGQRLTDDASSIVYFAPLDDYSNLLLVTAPAPDQLELELLDLRTGNLTALQTIEAPGWQAVSFVRDQYQLDIKLDHTVLSVPLYDPSGVRTSPAKIFTTVNPDRRREAAFEQAWADLKYRYYQRELEGRDWDAIGAKYRSYLGSIATSRELTELVSAMYGELSASHLFTNYAGSESTHIGLGTHNDTLGVYLDYGYEGPGRRVAAVLPGGPLDRAGLGIDAGDIITSINGLPVPEAGGLERLLDVNLGKRALIGVLDQGQDGERFIYVDPISYGSQIQLARARLLDARAAMVDRLSNACVAYQYVAGMDNDSYLNVLGTLTSSRNLTKAALIDVRSNGGGNLTRELTTLLSGTAYAQVGRTGGPTMTEPNNRWVWPSAVLVDSFGYSDAAIFPQAYQDAGIGILVGDTVLNTGTYVAQNASKLVPGFNYAIPVLPSRRLDGSYYENHVIEPDVAVPFDPNTVGINTDPQLEAAVAALMKQIGPETDCRLP